MCTNKEEYYNFFIQKKNKYPILDAKGIRKYDEELYNNVIEFKETYYVNEDQNFSETLLCYLKNIISRPLCEHCNQNITKFKQFSVGYFRFCSTACSARSIKKQELIKNTCLEKYGHINVAHGKGIKERIKATMIERYEGHSSSSEAVKNKIKATNLERYGYECAFQSEVVKDKIKATNLERYGYEYAMQNKNIRNKVIKTGIENGNWYKWNLNQIISLNEYKQAVSTLSNKSFRDFYYQINPKKLKRSRYEWTLDHIYPIIEGWKNNIKPEDISHPRNLQMLWHSDNRSKGAKTTMSVEDFYKLIKEDF